MEDNTNDDYVMTRKNRRNNDKVEQKLRSLINQYVRYKNKHIVEQYGEISLLSEVFICFDDLNQKWTDFCHKTFNIHSQNTVFRKTLILFRQGVDNHLKWHREICWTNFVLRYCKRYLNCFPTVTNIRSHYTPEADPFLAADIIKQEIFAFMKNILSIPATGYKKEYASKVSELTPDEYIFYIDLVIQLRMNLIDLAEFKTQLILKLVNVSSNIHYEKLLVKASQSDEYKAVVDHINANIHLLMDSINGFFEEKEVDIPGEYEDETGILKKEKRVVPIVNFTKQLQPIIKVPFLKYFKRKLYGPTDQMGKCTFYELRTAHNHFVEYANHNENSMALSKLIATLYRPKKLFLFIRKHLPKYNGDIRSSITSKTNSIYLEKRAKKINKLDVKYQFGVFQFFRNMEEFLRYGKITIGENQIELKILYESDPDIVSTGPDIGMSSILFNVAETGTLGSVDQVDNSNMWDIIVLLYWSVKNANDQKATYAKLTKNGKP